MVYSPPLDFVTGDRQRLHLSLTGIVQGVGFRPFVYGLAQELGLTGWIQNSTQGVSVELEGTTEVLQQFCQRLLQDKPRSAQVHTLEQRWLQPLGFSTFEILASSYPSQRVSALVLPDLSTCSPCLQEVLDPGNRRYHYPFTNCTHCGPRLSILQGLPYDRPNTTMGQFQMCPDCQAEYTNPRDRRFHAQPNACPRCGPQIELWDKTGHVLARQASALNQTVLALQQGQIVALKGLGGFHLLVDACDLTAVQHLRQRKHRPDKPLALMYPSLDLIHHHCQMSVAEEALLRSPEAPIVLIQPRLHPTQSLECLPCAAIAPQNSRWGIMVPYTPLHHLLLAAVQRPLVATSGNRSNDPICLDEQEALETLGAIADVFLVHNRPIARPIDDSIAQVVAEKPVILRRARGYAPLPVASLPIPASSPPFSILAVGAHLKNTLAFSLQDQVFLSQHLGDLTTVATLERVQDTIASFQSLYQFQPNAIACDLHPDYASTHLAQDLAQRYNVPLIPVQHHHAHVLAGMADHRLAYPVLGVAWDGTGYGTDGTIWGGEWLQVTADGFQRVAHLRPFGLPGGDQAVQHPCRSALGLLYRCFGEALFDTNTADLAPLQAFSPQEWRILKSMLQRGLNCPQTSSMGRLFDAIASLLNLVHHTSFEGQAAIHLESILPEESPFEHYPIRIYPYSAQEPTRNIVDWEPWVRGILLDLQTHVPVGTIAAKFHHTLVGTLVAIAQSQQIPQIVLTGGCFQNRYLVERAILRLQGAGFQAYGHHQIPPNDGGIAVGQIMGAFYSLNDHSGGSHSCVLPSPEKLSV